MSAVLVQLNNHQLNTAVKIADQDSLHISQSIKDSNFTKCPFLSDDYHEGDQVSAGSPDPRWCMAHTRHPAQLLHISLPMLILCQTFTIGHTVTFKTTQINSHII